MAKNISKSSLRALCILMKDQFGACGSFMVNLQNCETWEQVRRLLISQNEFVAEALDIEIANEDDLHEEIEDELQCIHDSEMEYMIEKPLGMIDDMKMDLFLEHMNKYSLSELENRLTVPIL